MIAARATMATAEIPRDALAARSEFHEPAVHTHSGYCLRGSLLLGGLQTMVNPRRLTAEAPQVSHSARPFGWGWEQRW